VIKGFGVRMQRESFVWERETQGLSRRLRSKSFVWEEGVQGLNRRFLRSALHGVKLECSNTGGCY